jgi:hypothetical protein
MMQRLLRVGLVVGSLCGATAALQLGCEGVAEAASAEKPKVAVGGFSNDKKGELREAFLAALREDGSYEITDAEDIKSTANARAVADAASAMEVNVVITGKVQGSSVKLKVMGPDGQQLDAPEIKGTNRAKLKSKIQNTASLSVADGVERAMAEERARAEKEEQAQRKQQAQAAKADDDDDSDDKPACCGLSPLDLSVGVRGMHRTFRFHQTIAELRPNDGFGKLRSYKLPLGPVVFADLNWYPGAHFAKGQAERIGLTGGYEKGFAISTVYEPEGAEKQTLTTNEQAFYVGARYRVPIAAHELGGAVTYGRHTFELQGDNASPLIPDVKYAYVKLGLDGAIRIGRVSVAARVGKRFVLSTGALERVWFPGSVKTQSLEAGISAGYRLLPVVEVVAGFDWLRYAFDFNPVRRRAGSESLVAGGAVDEYWYGSLGVRLSIPGDGEQSSAAASSAPKSSETDDNEDE